MLRVEDLSGCWTALVTPFKEDFSIHWEGFEKNLKFQEEAGIRGVVPVGTTGESPTLTTEEHLLLILRTQTNLKCLAGCGSNSTEEALHYAAITDSLGCAGGLFVDPYYNGPSSLEIRENYYRKIAQQFPDLTIVPYIIPGRTGCALSPEDLAILARECPNIRAVKEATGDFERMRRERELAPKEFQILSGDDDKTFEMMADEEIQAAGVISVISNIAPSAVQEMCEAILKGQRERAEKIRDALQPLFEVVTVTAVRVEKIGEAYVEIRDKFRNPLPIKTMMQGLGLPAGPCRPPLGKMTRQGVEIIKNALIKVFKENSWVLEPIEDFYGVTLMERFENEQIWQDLAYS